MTKKERAATLELVTDAAGDPYLRVGDGNGRQFRLIGVGLWPIRDFTGQTGPPLESWVCSRCDEYFTRPDRILSIKNHLHRHHNVALDDPEMHAALAEARRLLEDKGWQARLAAERRHDELLHKAAGLRVEAIHVDADGNLKKARALRAQANAAEAEAKAALR